VLSIVPKPQDALHGRLIGVINPPVGSSQVLCPLPLKITRVALLLFKETSDLTAQAMTCQTAL
jgi:hypothetical protein